VQPSISVNGPGGLLLVVVVTWEVCKIKLIIPDSLVTLALISDGYLRVFDKYTVSSYLA